MHRNQKGIINIHKEEIEMKHHIMKFGVLGAAGWLSIALLLPAVAQAEISISSATVPVTATVEGTNVLTAQTKNIVGNTDATTITFGAIAATPALWGNLAQQYIGVSVLDNAPSWRLRSMTNNFTTQPSTTTWGFAYGGLVATNGAKAPMAWLNNTTLLPAGPVTGNPATEPAKGWTFLKDMRDVDDPATLSTTTANGFGNHDESFPAADAQGYTNIAFGAPSFTRIVRPNATGGSDELTNTNDAWYFYVEADFKSSPAASYTSILILELLNQ